MKKLLALLVTLGTLNLATGYAYAQNVNFKTVQTEVSNKQAILLDVRTEQEYAEGHLNQAILAPHDTIEQTIGKITTDKNQKIYLYCKSGRRSAIAVSTLKAIGYNQLIDLGSINELKKQGAEITNKNP